MSAYQRWRVPPRLSAVWLAAALCCACTEPPRDGEERLPPLAALPDAPRVQGYVTTRTTGVQLWYERIGREQQDTVLLINGSDVNAAMWDDGFVARFVEAGFQVVRYDTRDNGRSQWLPWPEGFDADGWTPEAGPIYPVTAHVDDLLGLLDGLAIRRAHLVGVSMGGMVAQLMAITHPHRVASLVLLSSSPSNSFDPDLAPADPAFFEKLASGWRQMAIRSMVQGVIRAPLASAMTETFLLFAYQPSGRDREEVRALVDRLLAHAPHNPRSAQGFAVAAAPSWVDRLPEIDVPTLIIHGEHDRMFPPEHARVLAGHIPGARLISVAGLGHGLPVSHFEPYLPDMLEVMGER